MAQRLGIAPGEFWRLCPVELRARAKGWQAQLRWEVNRGIEQAWRTAQLQRVEARKFPRLEDLLLPDPDTPKKSEAAQVRALFGMLPGPKIYKTRGTDAPASTSSEGRGTA